VTISGIIRLGQMQPTFGSDADPTLTPDQTRLDFWIYVNLDRISQQIPYPILPVYVQLTPDQNRTNPPIPILEPLDLSDGTTNLNYAFQWCLFAILFVVGYGYYLWRKELRRNHEI
jgi:surfeit locus 1 family protein